MKNYVIYFMLSSH